MILKIICGCLFIAFWLGIYQIHNINSNEWPLLMALSSGWMLFFILTIWQEKGAVYLKNRSDELSTVINDLKEKISQLEQAQKHQKS